VSTNWVAWLAPLYPHLSLTSRAQSCPEFIGVLNPEQVKQARLILAMEVVFAFVWNPFVQTAHNQLLPQLPHRFQLDHPAPENPELSAFRAQKSTSFAPFLSNWHSNPAPASTCQLVMHGRERTGALKLFGSSDPEVHQQHPG
jgi:hypothetical protein